MESDKYKNLFLLTTKDVINIINESYIRSFVGIFIPFSIILMYVLFIVSGLRYAKLDKKRSIERKEEERLKEENNKQYFKEINKKIQILEEFQNSQRYVIQEVKDDFTKKLNIHSNKQLHFENIENELKKMHEVLEERDVKYFEYNKKNKQD